MRCPDCNKFVAYDDSNEPEADDADVDAEGRVSGTVRVYLACAECGTELKEANFDLESDFTDSVTAHKQTVADKLTDAVDNAVSAAEAKAKAEGKTESEIEQAGQAAKEAVEEAHEECELEAEVEAELTSRTTGKGRGTKTFYGYHATVRVKCSCGDYESGDNEHDDDMQASQMDELT
jgi:hypothetical protein